MGEIESNLERLVISLYEINALKFGDFRMKVGINSPVYFDLRVVISYPAILEELSLLLWQFAKDDAPCDQLCGVPYTALPIATLISVHTRIPMLIRRKETKKYGTKKLIEGKFIAGERVIIIEDVVTSGSSILETAKDLTDAGLVISTAFVVVDREQGGAQNLAEQGITMRSLCTLSQIMDILHCAGKVDQQTVDSVKNYIKDSQIRPDGSSLKQNPLADIATQNPRLTLTYSERAKMAQNTCAAKLLELMERKKSNLCLAADVTQVSQLLSLARTVGPHLCILKTHIDILEDCTPECIDQLVKLADELDFMLLEDRKFSDIGNTVALQYAGGLHHIARWSHMVTAHPLPGDGLLAGLKSVLAAQADLDRGAFLVAEMSCNDNLLTPTYSAAAVKMLETHPDLVCGLVCQSPSLLTEPGAIQLTPGVALAARGDNLGQCYHSPASVVLEGGADVAVVGRGIIQHPDPAEAAGRYQQLLWDAYETRVGCVSQCSAHSS